MAKRQILYTCDSEGITLGVVGDTWMECLLALSDEFGEGVLPLYEKAKEELEQTAAAVAETFADQLDGIAEDMAGAVVAQAEAEIASDTASRREKVREAIKQVETADEPDGGGEQQSLPAARDSGPPEDDAPPPLGGDTDAPICTVCGSDTTPDFAELTKLEHGEIRCPACTP